MFHLVRKGTSNRDERAGNFTLLVYGRVLENWRGLAADRHTNGIERLLGWGVIVRASDEEQSECVDCHVGAAGTQADPTEFLAVENHEDGYVGSGGDQSD